MNRIRSFALLALLAAVPPLEARAQEDQCNTVDLPNVEEQYQNVNEMIYVEGPFLVRCISGAELRADRGTLNRLSRELLLIGNVDFVDPTRSLTASQATYSSVNRRLYATGNVVFSNRAEGMTIRGPDLEYFAATEGRPEAQVNAGGRPHLTLRPKQGATDGEPMEIDADRLVIIGQSDLSAFGSTVITQPKIRATSDEARYDGATQSLELRRNAVITGEDNILRGEVIQAKMLDNALQEVRARTNAVLEAKDLTVNAPDVQLFFSDDLVERTVARRGQEADAPRPVALSRTFRLTADSIDAVAPRQQLERVIAIGKARGETVDTLAAPGDTARAANPEEGLIASDWIVGDTIIGFFTVPDSVTLVDGAPADSSVELERIVSRGAAQSLYRTEDQTGASEPAAGAAPARRGVNFVSAAMISLRFKEGAVDTAELTGIRRGLYLDPQPAPTGGAGAPAGAEGAADD